MPNAGSAAGVTVTSLVQHPDAVEVGFDDGTTERFDVIVACDGIESTTRDQVFGPAKGYDSGWILWTWWADANRFDPTVTREWWGAGCFFGAYPAPGQVMCAAGGPVAAASGQDLRSNLERHLADLIAHVPLVGLAIDDLDNPYSWAMRDVRAEKWIDHRIALCGDAAVGFMPTAGVGASNAMRAAAGLADELSRANAATVPLALELYEKRCRRIVERSQTDSRRLARAPCSCDDRTSPGPRSAGGPFPRQASIERDYRQRASTLLTAPRTRPSGGSVRVFGCLRNPLGCPEASPAACPFASRHQPFMPHHESTRSIQTPSSLSWAALASRRPESTHSERE